MNELCEKYLELQKKVLEECENIEQEETIMAEMDEIWYKLTPEEIAEIRSVNQNVRHSIYYQQYIDLRQALLDARNAGASEDVITDQMNDVWEKLSQEEIELIQAEGSWKFVK